MCTRYLEEVDIGKDRDVYTPGDVSNKGNFSLSELSINTDAPCSIISAGLSDSLLLRESLITEESPLALIKPFTIKNPDSGII
jgi:hypothetical protein